MVNILTYTNELKHSKDLHYADHLLSQSLSESGRRNKIISIPEGAEKVTKNEVSLEESNLFPWEIDVHHNFCYIRLKQNHSEGKWL